MRKLIALLCLLVIVSVAAGCSDSEGSDGAEDTTTTEGSTEPTDTEPEEPVDLTGVTEEDYVAAWTIGLTSDDGGAGSLVLGEEEGACVAQGWVDILTLKGLIAANADPAALEQPFYVSQIQGLGLKPAKAAAAIAVFETCDVDVVKELTKSLVTGLDKEDTACVEANIDEDLVKDVMLAAFSKDTADPEIQALVADLRTNCDLPE